ncbi:hypothetical protein PIIN_11894 [Serendipita indica DSM 11827]|uniref:Uncharacterized protein n=1 Tax=Serendipita indica (strain DSM 11827) TaxID=1109443 RepID=G4TYD5_SERID|nr:hypothetical protein PIIN_11894 [Serendipita indica DSM 11827]
MDDVEWPLLTVEFNSLRDHPMDGIYEFIDLPGVGEQFETFSFEAMVRLVAKDSNAIVPIISFKELARSDWKKLPDTVSSGFGARANIVICTHLDQIHGENLNEQLSIVSKVFWPGNVKGAASNNIIPCSSLMGLSARALLDLSKGKSKPNFTSFWDPKRKKVSHPCAEKILGVSRPKENYERMPTEFWKAELEREMKESGLPDAIQKLAREMVDQAKQRALIQECQAVCKQLRKMITAQERKLLEARRTKRDFDAAKKEFEDARAKFYALINTWSLSKTTQEQIYKDKLDRGIKALSQKAESFIPLAIKKTLNDWSLGSVKQETDIESSRAPEKARATEQHGTTVLTVKSVAHAEEFLRHSQAELTKSLNELRRDFVISVRKMAEEARAKRFQDLKDKIKDLDPKMQPELREEIIEDLSNQSVNIRQVAFNQIKNKIKTTKTRHSASTAFRAIEEQLAKPLLTQKQEGQSGDAAEQQARQAVEDLGFILRAPITAVATIPFVFGLPIWPWIIHSQSFHLAMDVIEGRYREEIVKPWIKDLARESEKSLTGTITASSQVGKTAVENALAREDARYKRESEERNQNKYGMVPNMVALNSSLWAAESALQTIWKELRESLNSVGETALNANDGLH